MSYSILTYVDIEIYALLIKMHLHEIQKIQKNLKIIQGSNIGQNFKMQKI